MQGQSRSSSRPYLERQLLVRAGLGTSSATLVTGALILLAGVAAWYAARLWGTARGLRSTESVVARAAEPPLDLWFTPRQQVASTTLTGGALNVTTWDTVTGRSAGEGRVPLPVPAPPSGPRPLRFTPSPQQYISPQNQAPAAQPDSGGLVCAVSPDATRYACATAGELLLGSLAPGGRPAPVGRLTSDTGVSAVAFVGEMGVAVQHLDRFTLFDLRMRRPLIEEPSSGDCTLRTFGNHLLRYWPSEGMLILYQAAPPRFMRRQYRLGGRDGLGFAVSEGGRAAAAREDGTVLVWPTNAGGQPGPPVALVAPGLVAAIAFWDEGRVLVGGSFRGIHLLARGAAPQEIVPGVLGTRLLAVAQPAVAYAADRLAFARLAPFEELTRTGHAIWLAWMILAAGILLAPVFTAAVERELELVTPAPAPAPEEAPTLPTPQVPADLVEACASGNCVLYTGAGVSAQAGFPVWDAFVQDLYRWAAENKLLEADTQESLASALRAGLPDLVADGIVGALSGRASLLNDYLRRRFLDPSPGLPEALRLLRQVPFCAALTTNFDTLVERAFKDRRGSVFTHRDAEQLLEALTRNEFFVVKLYGTPEQAETLLVAPAQFREVASKSSLFVKFMESLLVSRTLLFVGASLEGIEAYLGGIPFHTAGPRMHYALVGVTGGAWRAKAESLERRYHIRVLPYTPTPDYPQVAVFLKELADAVQARTAEAGAKPAEASRLKQVQLENIGPFDSLTVDLSRDWNVILGDNGVGKSSILKAIAVAVCGQEAARFADRLIKSGNTHATITLVTDQDKTYTTRLVMRDAGAEVVSLPSRPLEGEGWLVLGFPPLRSVTWVRPKTIPREGLGRSTSEDVLPLVSGEIDPRLDRLKEWLVRLDALIKDELLQAKDNQAVKAGVGRFEQLRAELFHMVDQLTPGVRVEFVEVKPRTFEVMVRTDDGVVPIEAISQGTSSIIGWTGVVLQRLHDLYGPRDGGAPAGAVSPSERYALVLIDEIDAHMHPAWQQLLTGTVTRLFPNAQFIATTHSPLIASSLRANQILHAYRDPQRRMVIVERPAQEVKGWRADQILVDPLFGLEMARDPDTQEVLRLYTDLAARDNLSEEDQRKLEEAARALKTRLPRPAESKQAREAYQMVQQTFQDRFAKMPPQERKKLLDEVHGQIQEMISGSPRLK